ncbi:MAG: DUF4342 domain-containing protein [Firmicutes bacterium]|nr:DUF4342 domain-containing protein [Bacillota bacterium]
MGTRELEKIDLLRERMDLTYQEAVELLHLTEGSVVDALVLAETRKKQDQSSFEVRGREVLNKVQELLREGSVTKIRIIHDGKPVFVFPVTAGLAGVLIMPKLALLATSICLLGRCQIEVERDAPPEDSEPRPEA